VRKNMQTAVVDVIKRILEDFNPGVGLDSPIFPVMVVLFSAAMMQNASPDYLQEFTPYRREFTDAIAANMTNNGLWKDELYPASTWLKGGRIEEKGFIDHVRAAMGEFFYSHEAYDRRVEVLWINPERLRCPRHRHENG
jgi:hypothetical protein